MKFSKLFYTIAIIICIANCVKIQEQTFLDIKDDELCGLTKVGSIQSQKDGQEFKNLYVVVDPTVDNAIRITHKNVTIKNVLVHHAANARGIYFEYADGLTIENVQVKAYGVHAGGAQPCPTRKPFKGFNCNNIHGYRTERLVINNVKVEGGSKGILIAKSPGAQFTNVVAKNVRGPFPAGQCFQVNMSDDVSIVNFYCLNEEGKSWTEDTVSFWRSSNGTLKNGLIDGNNAQTGICVMHEGSAHYVHGGLIENVEAIHCQGCFSGYPSNGLVMRDVTCADSWCEGTAERGAKRNGVFNYWQFGNNFVDGVDGKDNIVENSYYYNNCPKAKLLWTALDQDVMLKKFEVTEIDQFTPREPLEVQLEWDTCHIQVPDILCEDFPYQRIGVEEKRVNANTGEPLYEVLPGQCMPNKNNEVHPNEDLNLLDM